MKNVATWINLAAAAFVGLGLSAAVHAEDAPQKAPKSYKIAVIPKGTTHEYWKAIHSGAAHAAGDYGVQIVWRGPLKEDNREEQIKVVEDMVNTGVDGIVLAPLDDHALRAPVEDAVGNNINVVIIDSDLNSDKYSSFVATDNQVGGKLGGEKLADLVGPKGRVIMLRYQEGSASTANREKGFMAAADEKGLQVVSSNQYGGATGESAYKASENLLAQYKKSDGTLSVDGIFCPNESTTFGMLRALQDEGLAGKVKFVGFDSSPQLVEGLAGGKIDALVLQDPEKMGYVGVKTMVEKLEGKDVPKRIDTGVKLVTKANMDQPEIKNLLTPDLTKWLKE